MQREDVARNFGFLMHDVARLMRTNYDRRVRDFGLTRSQWWVITHLYRNDGLNQSELADTLDIERASLGRLLDRLEANGWVRREPCEKDRRVKRVRLTEEVAPVMREMRSIAAGPAPRRHVRDHSRRAGSVRRHPAHHQVEPHGAERSPSVGQIARPWNAGRIREVHPAGGNEARKHGLMGKLQRATRRIGRFVLRMVLLVAVPLAAIAVGVYLYAESGRYVTTENAYVKSNVIAVSSDVSGRVEWVGVDDNTLVREGQILFRLEQQPFRIVLDRAEAELDLVRTQVEHLRTDYREAVAKVAEEEEKVKFLTRQLARQKKLRDRKLGREEAYDQAAHDLALAKQRVRVLRQQVQRALQSLGGDLEVRVEEHARFLRARAERDQAAIALADTLVEAPVDGVVSNMKLQAGEYVEEGEAVFSVIERGKIWVEANLKETQLTHVLEGQSASVVVDAYPGVEREATVDAIAPATGAEFSVLPPQNATGNWVKVVQRIPVLLDIEQPEGASPLRAGMTVSVSIDTERERTMPEPLRPWFGDDALAHVRELGRSLRPPTGFVSSAQAAGGE